MIGRIKARSLEDDSRGGDNLLQSLLAALGAGLQRGIGERLLAFKLDSAIFTAISINRHTFTPYFVRSFLENMMRHYSPLTRA